MTQLYRSRQGRRKPGRPRDEALDEAILQATLKLLGEQGYARMAVDAVAREAGTTKPSVYLRFGSKEGLATAALEYMRERGELRPSGETRADLVLEVSRFLRGASRPFGMAMLGTVLAEEHQTPELLRLFRERVVRPRRKRIRDVLERAHERGEIRPDADLDLAVNMLVGAYYAQHLEGRRVSKDWSNRVVDAVLAGLRTADGQLQRR